MEPRRNLIQWLFGGGLIASISSFLYPVIRFVLPPAATEAAVHAVKAGKIDDLVPNSGRIMKLGSRPVLLIRVSETEWRAFSAICTHLSCTVQFQQSSQMIWCACHNGYYDLNGQVVSGPPPRPLEEFGVHVKGADLIITRRG
jgi:Rieske Fe-S protein